MQHRWLSLLLPVLVNAEMIKTSKQKAEENELERQIGERNPLVFQMDTDLQMAPKGLSRASNSSFSRNGVHVDTPEAQNRGHYKVNFTNKGRNHYMNGYPLIAQDFPATAGKQDYWAKTFAKRVYEKAARRRQRLGRIQEAHKEQLITEKNAKVHLEALLATNRQQLKQTTVIDRLGVNTGLNYLVESSLKEEKLEAAIKADMRALGGAKQKIKNLKNLMTNTPTFAPTPPTTAPSAVPTASPSQMPTSVPTGIPSSVPTAAPTGTPTEHPTAMPTFSKIETASIGADDDFGKGDDD